MPNYRTLTDSSKDLLLSLQRALGRCKSGPFVVGFRRLIRSLRGLYAVRHWRAHLALVRVVMQPAFRGLLRRRPRLLFKYLHCNYLATGLDIGARLAVLHQHYVMLVRLLPPPALDLLLRYGLTVWRHPTEGSEIAVTIGYPQHDFEGELMLSLRVAGRTIYTLTCAYAPPRIVASGPALLVTSLQGVAHQLPAIRQVTRVCANTPPPFLLLSVLEGVAAAFRAEQIVAVGNSRQLAKAGVATGAVLFDYDRFWGCVGGLPTHNGFYLFPARLPEKPLQAFPSRHRSREVRKRAFKQGVSRTVASHLLGPLPDPQLPSR